MRTGMLVALVGLAVAGPVDAQIAGRIDSRRDARVFREDANRGAGRAYGTVRPNDRAYACRGFGRYGDHRWDDYGWDGDRHESWWRESQHVDRRRRDRDRDECIDWIRHSSRASRFAYEHDRLHDLLWREHLQWHRRNDRLPHTPGWFRRHARLHEDLAREHARWHRRFDRHYGYEWGDRHRYDDDHGWPGRARGAGGR